MVGVWSGVSIAEYSTKSCYHVATTKCDADETGHSELGRDLRTLEERRKSLIDHHWAVPSKDRFVDILTSTQTRTIVVIIFKVLTDQLTTIWPTAAAQSRRPTRVPLVSLPVPQLVPQPPVLPPVPLMPPTR